MDQQLDLGFPTAVRETHAAARAVACFDIVPSADAGARILDCGAWLGRRWGLDGGLYPLGRLHLSLWGLGLEPGEAQALDRMRAAADAVRRPPIEIDLVKAMQFGGGARVLGCGYGAKAALSGLHDALVEAAIEAGLIADRRRDFEPHVTTARDQAPMPETMLPSPICWRAEAFVLAVKRRGRPARMVGRWPLCGMERPT